MDGKLEHRGVITEIEGNYIDISMVVEEACEACKAKSMCGVDSGSKRRVTVFDDHPELYGVGDEVIVSVTKEMGVKAVTWAYIVPFLLMLGTLLLLLEVGLGEVISGLSSLGMLAVYYFALYLCRERIEKEIIFRLRRL